MMIREPKIDSARAKEVKVKIPVSYHIKLHSMKVLTGKQISDAITEALQVYFASHQFDESLSHHMPGGPVTADGETIDVVDALDAAGPTERI